MQQKATPQQQPARADAPMNFAIRPPSQGWEQRPIADCPPHFVWAWFKPAHVPQGLVARIPEESQQAARLTMRRLLQAVGVEPAAVWMWYLYGAPYDAMGGASPFLDAAIPPPPAGVDPTIVVCMAVEQIYAAPVMPAGMPPQAFVGAAGADSASTAELFERMVADWHAILETERECVRLRKMLVDITGRLKSMNRELTPPEKLHSNNQDKKDWIDARRWLRDANTRCLRIIKEHDIGDTSAAGHRKRYEHTYDHHVAPRIPFDGLAQAQRDFEAYRKTVTTLQMNMNSTYSIASLEAERRAQQILSRIAAKIRDAQTKRNFLGVIVD